MRGEAAPPSTVGGGYDKNRLLNPLIHSELRERIDAPEHEVLGNPQGR